MLKNISAAPCHEALVRRNALGRWYLIGPRDPGSVLREVANARVRATTGEVPAVRLEQERERLQPIPAPWPGAIQLARTRRPAPLPRGYQHPLRVYEELITEVG